MNEVVDTFEYVDGSNPRIGKKKVMKRLFDLAKERGQENFYKAAYVKADDPKYSSDGDTYQVTVYGVFIPKPLKEDLPSAEEFGEEMSEAELAKMFGEPPPEPPKALDFSKMTLEEIEQWEKDQVDSNSIYRVAARVKNLAREGGAGLTPTGEVLCNVTVHALKDFYDFAEKLSEPFKKELKDLARKHESMAADVIQAVKNGVGVSKDQS